MREVAVTEKERLPTVVRLTSSTRLFVSGVRKWNFFFNFQRSIFEYWKEFNSLT